jgi:hypothetical protein
VIIPLTRREFGYGSGMISPNQLMFIVDIPKNASSFIHDWTAQYGWGAAESKNHEHRISQMIVILRDPLDRWISGISQYINGWILHAKGFYDARIGPDINQQYVSAESFIEQYNPVVERLIFDNLDRFDDHVWPQSEIIDGLLPTKHKHFYYMDGSWEDRLSAHLGIPKAQEVNRNAGSSNKDQHLLQKFFYSRINDCPSLKNMIIDRYQQDYDLIKKVIL